MSDGSLPRSRYGRVVRSRANARADLDNKNSSNQSSQDKIEMPPGQGAGKNAVHGIEGNTKDNTPKDRESRYANDILESEAQGTELYNGDGTGRVGKLGAMGNEIPAVRKAGRPRKRSASELENSNGDYEYVDNKKGAVDAGNTSRQEEDVGEREAGKGKGGNGVDGGDGGGGVGNDTKKARTQPSKPGKGYKFCHACDKLIANRRFFCTWCGSENPSARRAPKIPGAKEEGKVKSKVGRPKKRKSNEGEGSAGAGVGSMGGAGHAVQVQMNGSVLEKEEKGVSDSGSGGEVGESEKREEAAEDRPKKEDGRWDEGVKDTGGRDEWGTEDGQGVVEGKETETETEKKGGESGLTGCSTSL